MITIFIILAGLLVLITGALLFVAQDELIERMGKNKSEHNQTLER